MLKQPLVKLRSEISTLKNINRYLHAILEIIYIWKQSISFCLFTYQDTKEEKVCWILNSILRNQRYLFDLQCYVKKLTVIRLNNLKTHRQISKKRFRKALFLWSSMPSFSFIGYTLTELSRKSDNWRQIYKTNEFDFLYLYIKRCVEKKKILVRHNKVAK